MGNQEGIKDTRSTEIELLLKLLPFIGISTALLYFLGRLRTESYYYFIGINPLALSFTIQDYMFSSFNLVLIIVIFCFFAWFVFKAGAPNINELTDNVNKSLTSSFLFKIPPYSYLKGIAKTKAFATVSVILALLFYIALPIVLLIFAPRIELPLGIMGLVLGITMGFGFIFIASGLGLILREGKQPKQKRKISGDSRILTPRLLLFVIILSAVIPIISSQVGKSEANYAINNQLPTVILHYQNNLPEELLAEPSVPSISKEVTLVTINKGMIYVIYQDNKLDDEWQVYSMPEDKIEQIIYQRK